MPRLTRPCAIATYADHRNATVDIHHKLRFFYSAYRTFEKFYGAATELRSDPG